jgi:hypothetical protein
MERWSNGTIEENKKQWKIGRLERRNGRAEQWNNGMKKKG